MRYSASQFFFGERVSIPLRTDSCEVNPERVGGIVCGWDQTNTHLLVQIDIGEQRYYRIDSIRAEAAAAKD